MDTKKPSTEQPGEDKGVLPYILLHQSKRDRALGLPRPGARTMSLLDYRRQQEREATKSLMGAAFCKAVIEECQKEVRSLIDGADTADKRRGILEEVKRLNALAQEATSELEKMTYAG